MANEIEPPTAPTFYPGQRRMAKRLCRDPPQPHAPAVVAETIRNHRERTWQLRHPVGPEAAATLAGRAATPDEDYIAVHALADDNTWYDIMEEHRNENPAD